MTQKQKSITIFFIISFILILLDQLTKLWIKNYFAVAHTGDSYTIGNYQNIRVIGDFLQFTYVENEGMAFGISFGAGKILLSLFSIFASVAISWYLIKIKNYSNWIKLAIALILAGAVGNLIDRVFYGVIFGYAPLFYGRVIDFVQVDIPDIDLGFIRYQYFPVFNIADSCVNVGVVLLLIFHKKIPTFKMLKNPENTVSENVGDSNNQISQTSSDESRDNNE
jgi:signal peptidase II